MTESRTSRSNTGLNSYQDPVVEERDVGDSAPAPIPRFRAPRQSVLRRPGLFEEAAMSSESGTRPSVDFNRLRFDNNAITVPPPQPPSASMLRRQPVLSARASPGHGGSTMSTVIEEPAFSDELDVDYATPEWDSTMTERTQLLTSAGNAFYSGDTSSRNVESRSYSADNAERYEEDAFDDDDPLYIKSVYMLSCSILMIVSVVFVIVVSGLTKLVSRRGEPKFHVKSNWPAKGFIPAEYGCNAANGKPQSIPLTWFNVPKEATNLVLLLANVDTNRVHWLVTNIPLTDSEGVVLQQLPANASENEALMPVGAHEFRNNFQKNGHYAPPCALHNHTHTYLLYLFAIDANARIRDDFKYASEVINGFVGVPTARLLGKYGGTSRNIQVVGHGHDPSHDHDRNHDYGQDHNSEDADNTANEKEYSHHKEGETTHLGIKAL